jgi:hypothetical protein
MQKYKISIELEDWFNQYATKEELEIAFRDLLKINCATLNLSMTYTDITKKRG